MKKKSVLFLCTHNAVRSQMAEGLLRSLYSDRYEACSAGLVKTGLDPAVVYVMAELGIDVSGQRSKAIDVFSDRRFDVVVTVCDHAKEACPFFPGKTVLHHGFTDPGLIVGPPQERLDAFRRSRDAIKAWIIDTFGQDRGPAVPNEP